MTCLVQVAATVLRIDYPDVCFNLFACQDVQNQNHINMNGTIPPLSGISSQRKTSALAVWSLVLGIVGLVIPCFAIFTVIPGIICGHMGLSRINKSGGGLTGNGLAIAGLI